MIRFDRGSVGFNPYGEYWRQVRKICVMELLSPSHVRRFGSLRESEISNLMESVRHTSGLPFDVSKMIFSCTNSVISKAKFGQNCKRQKEFVSAIKEQQSIAGQFSIPEIFPFVYFLYHLDGIKRK
ncbi:hypothetical protein MLD38_038530 [Melastoma candidum]|uniref:Uncharacterized protein n=1 Tax=Melastoma candidum TaxID=119954 RepID=A0ACB9KZX5_9MYRT|nr:hypothetical protein MLD38_038530 [Melastoma candidum]